MEKIKTKEIKFKKEQTLKNCKNTAERLNNGSFCSDFDCKIAKNAQNQNSNEKEKIAAFVKALFTVYPSIPNIVSVIDNIVLQRASSIMPLSNVYGSATSTRNEIEKVIDLSDRKMRLLNLVALIREILSGLSENDYETIDMKFFKRMKTSSIASRLEIDERSVFRRINKAIERSVSFCVSHDYDSVFLSRELEGEMWIKEIYNKSMLELAANKLRSQKNMKKF